MLRRVPLLIAVVLLSGLALAPAKAAFPGENGNIAFERGRDVWLMGPDGSNPVALTTGGGTFDPAIGPGGSRIAFARGGDIWVMNSDGTGQTNLTPAADPAKRQPAWSPDGTKIAFSQVPPGERSYRIWVMNSDGSNPVQLTFQSSGDFEPTWSPDGGLIAYTRINNSSDIWTVNPAQPGSELEYASSTRTEDQPTWAPDGSAIAFRANRGQGDDIYKQVGRGGPGEPVTNVNPAADSEPSWSPDGSRIAFATTRGGGSQVWSVASTGVEVDARSLSGTVLNDGQPDWAQRGTDPQVTPPPKIGETVNAVAVKGTVTVKVPVTDANGRVGAAGSSDFVPLEKATQLPIGSTFNTKRGTVKLTFAASRTTSATQTGKFRGGLFTTLQGTRSPMTELRLRGAGLNKCSKLPKGGAAAARRRSRSLFANARGRFRTRGRNSTATVRGTQWVQKDSCRGTLTAVTRGSVLVRDLTKRRNIRLKAGQKYLARPPKRR